MGNSSHDVYGLPQGCVPYVLKAGEGSATVTLGQAIRVLAGKDQTNGAFTICSVIGPKGHPIPQHWHDEEHDTFVCVRGSLQLWADDQSRILAPGGFANVPPKVKHAYALHDHHSELVGLISPGGFEEFFAATGNRYDGPAYPVRDDEPVKREAFARAGAESDVNFVMTPVYVDAGDDTGDVGFPCATEAYFLRPGAGERHVLGAVMLTVMCGLDQTRRRFGMSTLEGGPHAAFAPVRCTADATVLYVMNGIVELTLGHETHTLHPGDTANIPADEAWAFVMTGADNRILVFSEHDVVRRLFVACGLPWEAEIYPKSAEPVDWLEAVGLLRDLPIKLVDVP